MVPPALLCDVCLVVPYSLLLRQLKLVRYAKVNNRTQRIYKFKRLAPDYHWTALPDLGQCHFSHGRI